MASCSVFEEDEIYAFDEQGYKIGLVLESSEYVSSDEDDDPDFDYDRVKRGTVRVAWHPNGGEELVAEKEVGLADRSLMPGDVVRRMIQGQDSQRGYVRRTNVKCHLQLLGTNKIIANVDSKELEPLRSWDPEPGDVVLDSWVGKIEHVNEEVTLRFPDGAICKVCDDDFVNDFLFEFEDMHERRPRDSEFCVNDYYIGQQFRGELSDLASANWVKTTNAHNPQIAKKGKDKGKLVVVTVDKVETKSIDIHWLCRGYAKVENPLAKLDAPPRTLHKEQIKRLRKLDCFEQCSVQIGDKMYYSIKNTDLVRVYSGNKTQGKSVLQCLLEDLGEVIPKNTNQRILEATLNSRNSCRVNGTQEDAGNSAEGGLSIEDVHLNEMGDAPIININDALDAQGTRIIDAQSKPSGSGKIEGDGKNDVKVGEAGKGDVTVAVNDTKVKDTTSASSDGAVNDGATNAAEKDEEPGTETGDSEYEDEDDGNVSDAGSTGSAHSSASNASNSSPRRVVHKKGPVLQNRLLKKKKLRRAKRREGFQQNLKPGDRVAVEVVYTISEIEIMWQDGTVENKAKSTDLFPIHHLDELEFFPGDFVISSQVTEENATDSSYGVIEKVDHGARTCFVRWMKPYQVGKSNKPDESIVSEEVSVYDIKDHPEFKFRPGHVVVRVGGYDETHTEAAGQVYEMCQDGRIHIRWADASLSFSYPQELFLIGDELSELGSDLDASSEESGGEESDGSAASWETEEEEELEEGDNDQENINQDDIGLEPDCKMELDRLLETAKCTLQKLEEQFAKNVDITPWIINCYREILRINRNCKDLDRMLSSHYFTDTKLTQTISLIRKELKREKAAKIARQVLELFESNCKQVKVKEEGDKAEGQEGKQRKRSKNKEEGKAGDVCNALGASASMVEMGASGGGSVSETNLVVRETNDICTQTDESSPESVTKDASVHTHTPARDAAVQTMVSVRSANAKDLCQTACRLLKEQIVKVHEDLTKKWERMRELGILKALGHEEDDEETTEADIKALVSSVSKTNQSAMTACQIIANSESLGDISAALSSSASSEAQSSTSILIDGSGSAHCINSNSMPALTMPSGSTSTSALTNSTSSVAPIAEDDIEGANSVNHDMRSGLKLSLANSSTPAPSSGLVSPGLDGAAAAAGSPDLEELKRKVFEPQTPQTPAEIRSKILYNVDGFQVMSNVPSSHKFAGSNHVPTDQRAFFSAIKKELKMLRSSLPIGIYVKGFEDRMDLFTVMIMGPTNTPYEDGLFFFDVQLPNDYPASPPNVFFISFCSDRLNPNLYEDGKVCVSLLGTWAGRGTEVWTNKSSLLQVLISIQGLILVSEPYYNEAGYEKQKGSQQAGENSRMYNEMAICKLVQSMARIASKPPIVFELEVLEHMRQYGFKMVRRLEHWLKLSGYQPAGVTGVTGGEEKSQNGSEAPTGALPGPSSGGEIKEESTEEGAAACETPEKSQELQPQQQQPTQPEFPLFPCSRGFCLTLYKHLEHLRGSLLKMGLSPTP